HFRYLVPVAPLLFAVTAAGLARFELRLDPAVAAPRRIVAAIGLVPLCAFWLISREADVVASRRAYAECFDRGHRVVAATLASLPPGRIALSDAGIIPYRTDWPALDLVGLNDRRIARTHDRS